MLKPNLFISWSLIYAGLLLTSEALSYQAIGHEHEIVIPKRIFQKEKRDIHQEDNSRKEQSDEEVSYLIKTKDDNYILKLYKNSDLLSKDFVHVIYNKDGKRMKTKPQIKNFCHYHGIVDGIEHSMVAISTCEGLRGILHVGQKRLGIKPYELSEDYEHIIYPLDSTERQPFVCGVPHHSLYSDSEAEPVDILQHEYSMTGLLRKKRAALPVTRYIELFLVADNGRYLLLQSNVTAVQNEMVQLANALDGIFMQLNVRVILVGVETWTDNDKIVVNNGSAGDVLGRFVAYREKNIVPIKRNDIGHLVVTRGSYGGVVGMAFVGTVCSSTLGGSIGTLADKNVEIYASVAAHEIGHNLGMSHDDSICNCKCIMCSSATNSRNFSDASANDFQNLIDRGGGSCLLNIPPPQDVYTEQVCGNNIVDPGEECDCGTPQQCTNPCCDAASCKFKGRSVCAVGLCCDNCQYKVAGTPCRPAAGPCDLPEYCNGTSEYCQPDVYIQNGYMCNTNNSAYCFDGVCETYDLQCNQLFRYNAVKAADVCYQVQNAEGDKYGNCGGINVKCSGENVMCGKLQCTDINLQDLPSGAGVSLTTIGNSKCANAAFNLGSDVPDPGYVKKGTRCAEGKVCANFACVNASVLGYDCDVQKKCNGHGVCNSNKNCHCDNGWAPPSCNTGGYGGSIDSGPTHIDTSLRDGLLIFFLLVVPVLALIIFLIYWKRQPIKKLLFGPKKTPDRYRAENNVQHTPNRNQPQVNNPRTNPTQTNNQRSFPPQFNKPATSTNANSRGVSNGPTPRIDQIMTAHEQYLNTDIPGNAPPVPTRPNNPLPSNRPPVPERPYFGIPDV
ncbi:disintegrin and metalloproteinase domain-containing protein 9-like [Protopterus annectens]|uniref:disintegrin and metalloproteinase domain-containing protein 9-like n=1 Tax=Protopterus annectens TaxID=7888 RepID=UPI001CFAE6B2|nr:disintegrin and metalloproteinase domain-containing protein 9-like [Protopterus annectens]